ncbi:MAG: mycothiol system anti-sigma-R factor, partial [Actinomyces graevenitzii]|nr:mycothiol system anti-sigma-R factor [Actinomyces graevenitzii]
MPETIVKGCSCAETLAHLHAFVDRECDEQLTARL